MNGSDTRLGVFDIACVVVGGIIGVGIFFTPRDVASVCDNELQVMLAWAIGGGIAVLGALVFAALSRRVPGHGGTFLYIHRAFGALPAFLYGWANWLVIQAGALGVIGLILAEYLDVLLFGVPTSDETTRVVVASAAISVFTIVNAVGLRVGKTVQNVLTITKTVAVFLLVSLAFFAGGGADAEPLEPPPVDSQGRGLLLVLGAAMLPVLFSFGGWQQGSFVAGAARVPSRDVPLGILAGVAVVVVAYLTVNLSFLSILGFEGAAQSTAIGADAARTALAPYGLGEWASRILAGMIVVSALGILNTICLAPPFVLHAMAEERLFLARVGALHPRTGTPIVAVLCQGLWGIVLLLVAHFVFGLRVLETLVTGVVFVDWLFFALCGLALLRLRPSTDGVVIPVLFTLCAFAVMAGAIATSPEPAVSGLCATAVGLPFYLVLRRTQSSTV